MLTWDPAGLVALSGACRLRVLSLSGCGVTDGGVDASLASLAGLVELDLCDTDVSDDAADRLRIALPNLRLLQ